jgi:hypothetical protein
MNRYTAYLVTAATTLVCTFVLTPTVSAQSITGEWPAPDDAPYAPRSASVSDLIDTGTFANNPLDFPFDVTEATQVARFGRMDFRVDLSVPLQTALTHFERAYDSQKAALSFKPWAVPDGTDRDLMVTGLGETDDAHIISLAHPPTNRRFTLELTRKSGEVRIFLRNQTITHIFGAMTPLRAPFTPIDAEPIPLFYE